MTNKSCFNCKNVRTWDHAATREDPGDTGWECGHPDQKLVNSTYEEPAMDILYNELLFADYCAKSCPAYEFFDWGEHHRQQDNALAEEVLSAYDLAADLYAEDFYGDTWDPESWDRD